MAEISATMVKALREQTGLGMMECKKALAEADGDMVKAEDLLRIRSGAKASKAAGRVAAEGAVAAFISEDKKRGALVEVNSETDFVAKNEDFGRFAQAVAQAVTEHAPADVEAVMALRLASGEAVEAARQALIMKLGENINVRRFARLEAAGQLAAYLHGLKIGVLVDVDGGEALGRDLAMHIAASRPVCVSAEQVPAELITREREIYRAQAAESGKPANIVEKMVDGRVQKFLAETTLMGQPFVKNPDLSVAQLLTEQKAKVHAFAMFVVGEGIEKKTTDFAAEVRAQAGQG